MAFFACSLGIVFGSSPPGDPEKELTPNTIRKIDDQIIPIIAANNLWRLHDVASPIIAGLTQKQLTAVDEYMTEKGHPTLMSKYLDAKIQHVEQGGQLGIDGKKPRYAIAIFIARGINQRLNKFLERVELERKDLREQDFTKDWSASREIFWRAHVLKSEFTSYLRLAELSKSMLNSHASALRKADIDTLLIAAETKKLVEALPKLQREFIEHEAELRLARFDQAFSIVSAPGEFKVRFLAATCVEQDSEVLVQFLESSPEGSFDSVKLNEEGLANRILTKLDIVRNGNDQIAIKARLLRRGLHYWLRGRYGSGTMVYGLLKSPTAMDSHIKMDELYMPRMRPDPITPFAEENSHGYDRRHHYTWAVERRELESKISYDRMPSGEPSSTDSYDVFKREVFYGCAPNGLLITERSTLQTTISETSTETTITPILRRSFQPEDGTIPYRFVGSYEYALALEAFEKLVAMSTPAELFVYDDIIIEQPEFTFYSGLQSVANGPNKLNIGDPNSEQRKEVEASFRRNTLPWLIALARIELGATMSLYGNGESPFELASPKSIGLREYLYILRDDLATHLIALDADPKFQQVLADKANSDTLAYLRRLKVLHDMLTTMLTSNDPATVQAGKQYQDRIMELGRKLVKKVKMATKDRTLGHLAMDGGTVVDSKVSQQRFRGWKRSEAAFK